MLGKRDRCSEKLSAACGQIVKAARESDPTSKDELKVREHPSLLSQLTKDNWDRILDYLYWTWLPNLLIVSKSLNSMMKGLKEGEGGFKSYREEGISSIIEL